MVDSPLYDLIDQPALLGERRMHETRRNTYRMADVDDVHKSVESAREKGLFLPRVKSRMVTPACDECMDHVIAGASGKLVLNITRDCNLRCTYCCFSGLYPKYHRHQSVSMPQKLCIKAIAHFMDKMAGSPAFHISFYGGEPLLEFDKIATAIAYVKQTWRERDISFHIDTNGTLFTEDIVRFCIANNLYLQISLDGPRDMHDKYRRSTDGSGTYDRVMGGLERIGTISEDYLASRISFNATLAPPYDLYRLQEFFATQVPSGAYVAANYVDPHDTEFYNTYSDQKDVTELQHQRDRLKMDYIENRASGREPSALQKALFERPLVDLHMRDKGKWSDTIPPNGICVPFVRRVFVDVNGSIYPCEKVGEAYMCGTISQGLSQEKVDSVIREYIEASEADCTECWAARLCRLCFSSAASGHSFSIARKRQHCPDEIGKVHEALVTYASILEKNPCAFDFVKDMAFD